MFIFLQTNLSNLSQNCVSIARLFMYSFVLFEHLLLLQLCAAISCCINAFCAHWMSHWLDFEKIRVVQKFTLTFCILLVKRNYYYICCVNNPVIAMHNKYTISTVLTFRNSRYNKIAGGTVYYWFCKMLWLATDNS